MTKTIQGDSVMWLDTTRPCWYQVILKYEMGKPVYSGWSEGRFHAWSMFHDEHGSGPGHWPVAIVENKKSGYVVVTHATLIKFGEKPCEDKKDSS